eukprot:SAG31_NODE_15617_length_746_cov_1.505410_1_plen_186_part_01
MQRSLREPYAKRHSVRYAQFTQNSYCTVRLAVGVRTQSLCNMLPAQVQEIICIVVALLMLGFTLMFPLLYRWANIPQGTAVRTAEPILYALFTDSSSPCPNHSELASLHWHSLSGCWYDQSLLYLTNFFKFYLYSLQGCLVCCISMLEDPGFGSRWVHNCIWRCGALNHVMSTGDRISSDTDSNRS